MKKNNNVWSIILKCITILLFAFIIALICVDFFDTDKTYFTAEIIIAIGISLVIACIEFFDSFQIGTIISLKRENKQIEKENEMLKNINANLTNIMASINNNISINTYANITSASQEEINNANNVEKENSMDLVDKNTNTNFETKSEFETLERYIQENNFLNSSIIKNAKMKIETPFMSKNLYFDLYIKNETNEEFVEVKNLVPSFSKFQYVYQQLFLIDCYNRINKANATFVLIINKDNIYSDNIIARKNKEYLERMKELFKEVIEKGKMKIVVL